jgi:hypothetical protein
MKALRTLKQVQNGQVHLHLPKQFRGQQVEIIVLSGAQQEGREEAGASLRGCLRQYANPSLAAQEEGAWGTAVEDEPVSSIGAYPFECSSYPVTHYTRISSTSTSRPL